MRGLATRLARAAPQAFRNADAVWYQGLAGAPAVLITQLISLRPLQAQQAAGYAAYKKPPSEEEGEDASEMNARKGHLPRPNHGTLRQRAAGAPPPPAEQDAEPARRQERIRDLLRTMAGGEDTSGAFRFIDSFFEPGAPAAAGLAAAAASLASARAPPPAAAPADEEPAFVPGAAPPLSEGAESEVLAELRGLRRGSQRIVLQKLLQGGMLRADPVAMAEWQAVQAAFRPPEGFRMKVVDVNRTCKGTRSGGLYRFSAMVVVGNGEGVLGWGQGKATEVAAAVRKAYQRACRNLYPIPRFNRHTIPEPATAKFGKVKVVMYPKASGRGIVASTLVTDICKLAGIHDIGVKIHGSRNPRNTVKCLFEAFDGMATHEEILAGRGGADGRAVTVAVPCGRFGRLAAEVAA